MFYAIPTHIVNSTQLLPIFVDVKKCASRIDNNFLLRALFPKEWIFHKILKSFHEKPFSMDP